MNTVSISAYVKRHWGLSQKWDGSRLVPWLDWFINDGRLHTITRRGRVVGLGMGRLLLNEADHAEPYAHDEAGQLAWIDLLISQDKTVAARLWGTMLKRFGMRDKLGFQRDAHAVSAPRFHKFTQMQRIIHYGIK